MRKRIATIALCFLFAVFTSNAQANSKCPTLQLSAPDLAVEGTDVTFTMKLSEADQGVTPTYNWSVSAGTIKSGQGTPSIVVDTTDLGGQTVTASVDIGGLDPACERTRSVTTSIDKKVEPLKSDEYSSTTIKLETERLDRFAIALMNDPMVQGYIMAYGGRVGQTGEAQVLADRTRKYLIDRGIEPTRLVTVDSGFREQLTTELWIVPPGATPPEPQPTVDPSEVKPLPQEPKKTTPPKPRRSRP
jgi:hypothetical protein